jgi:hypothetical protein
MSYTDALDRVQQIQAQLSALTAGPGAPAAAPPTAGPASTSAATSTPTVAPSSSTSFSDVLARAQARSLPASAAQRLTSGQQQFVSRLAQDTGLDPQVVSAWVLAEENGSAATARETAGNNDWLNIGYTDSGTYGASDSVWGNPTGAADATAGWLKGSNTIPGYGTASSGIQAILATAGQTPSAQIAAIQQSGWASSGYPDLSSLYQSLAG